MKAKAKTPELQKTSFASPVLNSILGVLIILFCLSLFKNVSYPLVWNDESEGIMAGQRILEYGYPKVHDGKNTVISSLAPGINVGYKEKYDANIIITWGNYYWCAIGVFLAKFTNDIYTKTALLRLPFTVMGLFGLLLFVFSARKLFSSKEHFKIFAALFVFVELFSIALVLHMREARYFSLVIFLSACFFYIYSNYFLFHKMSNLKYWIGMTLLLFFTFHVNFIAFAILAATLAFNRGIVFLFSFFRNPKSFKQGFIAVTKESIPLIASAVLVYPFVVFFEMAKTSAAMSEFVKFTFESYQTNLGMIYDYLTNLEFAYTFIIVKAIWLILKWYLPKQSVNKKITSFSPVELFQKFSLFATSFLVIYALIIARTPWLFVRHYIVLQPVLVLILITDIFLLFAMVNQLPKQSFKMARNLCLVFLVVTFSVNARNKLEPIKDHLYEMTHQYKGCLDYVIPYIQEKYPHPDSLVIATNYEEFSYMYYLGSKVTIGYVYNNLEDDLKYIPDIILYRKSWGTDPKYFNEFMQKAKYQKVTFPVADYFVNNIPEFGSNYVTKHLFRTKLAQNEQQMVEMYIRVKE